MVYDDDFGTDDELGSDGLWHVYFLTLIDPRDVDRDFGLVKVGITKGAVERRIENLQTGNPYQIKCEASFASPVARAVECWVHKTQPVAHLEWLALKRSQISALVDAAQIENERLTRIAEARAQWSRIESNGVERQACREDSRIHDDVCGVLEDLLATTLQFEVTNLRIALMAGAVGRIPGVIQVSRYSPYRRFDGKSALARFPQLAAGHMIDRVKGHFRWRDVPTRGEPQWTSVRGEIDALKRGKQELDLSMLQNCNVFLEEGNRTDGLVELHEKFIALFQRIAQLKVDRDYLKATAIHQMEACEAVSGLFSYKRQCRSELNGESFRAAYHTEALECSTARDAFVRRRVFMSRSY